MEYCPAHGTDEQRGHEFDDSFYRLQGLDAVLDSSEAVSRRQDVGTRVGVFRDGRLIGYPVNTADPYADDGAYALRDWLAAVNRVDRGLYEVLRGCPNHPDVPIVDCTDCVPALDG